MPNEDIIKFIASYTNIPVGEKSRIETDLQIRGDQAIDFLNDFAEKFNVDISNFNFKKYFKTNSNSAPDYAITVQDLEKASIIGTLDEDTLSDAEISFRPHFSFKSIVLGIVIAIFVTFFLSLFTFWL